MKYKALLLDVDGTLVVNQRDGVPTQRIVDAIEQAKTKLSVGIATNRSRNLLDPIFEAITFSAPCAINGATQIIDPITKKNLWEQKILPEDIEHIISIARQLDVDVYIQNDTHYFPATQGYHKDKVMGLLTETISADLAEAFLQALSGIPTINAHKTSSWEGEKMHVSVNHVNASKQYAVYEIAKLLQITPEEIIGVGDHYNDFPLLMACGLKIAMGNAVDDLKAIADYIAPSVEEDGVANVIEEFIL